MSDKHSPEPRGDGSSRRKLSSTPEPKVTTLSHSTQGEEEATKQMRVGEESIEVQEAVMEKSKEGDSHIRDTNQEEQQKLTNKNRRPS